MEPRCCYNCGIADRLTFKKWYFGHFHGDWQNGIYEMLFENIKEFKL